MPPEGEAQFEQYLSGFEPLPPGPLPEVRLSPSAKWGAPLATAAMVILSVGMLLWRASLPHKFVPSNIPPGGSPSLPTVVTLGGFNLLLRGNPSRLDAQLSEISRGLLPNVERTGSTLGALSK